MMVVDDIQPTMTMSFYVLRHSNVHIQMYVIDPCQLIYYPKYLYEWVQDIHLSIQILCLLVLFCSYLCSAHFPVFWADF